MEVPAAQPKRTGIWSGQDPAFRQQQDIGACFATANGSQRRR
jgi:hypothetical protein